MALELWVDVERVPTVIRLSGTLDSATGANLMAVVEELMADGVRRFEMDISALHLCECGGAMLLDRIRQLVESRGGCLQLDQWVEAEPGSDDVPSMS